MTSNLKELEAEYRKLSEKLKLPEKEQQLRHLTFESEKPNFWADNLKAQGVMKQIAKLSGRLNPWLQIRSSLDDLKELAALNDKGIEAELSAQVEVIRQKLTGLKDELKLSGQYDDYDVILNIYAGAGGTDAQDWAQMLLRMYSRWAEKNRLKITVIDQTPGEEAGIKSTSLDISGPFAYGKLKGEQGVHRLVRLSPFNADNLRQTSFAKIEVYPKIERPDEVSINDKDLKVDVFRSGGHGGQSVNTTDSAVRITHIPTNTTITIQNERSQLQNKELAMTILRSRLASLQLEQHVAKISLLKGPSVSAEWGNQIRSYVLHPYKQVKDLRTGYESKEPDKVLDGDINPLIESYLDYSAKLE
ncbi:MAG: peptide chain release factor 2 [Candidatus Saccharimonadales bacterium]